MAALRVLLATDDALARAGLRSLLAADDRFVVISDGRPSDERPDEGPDVALWLATDRGDAPATPFVALVADERAAHRALGAGARGVLLRDADGARIGAALVGAANGLVVLDERLGLVPRESAPSGESLTPRELEVLQLVARGLANKEIARRLSVSEHTAKFHVNAILAKLGARSRTDAVVRAARLGLLLL